MQHWLPWHHSAANWKNGAEIRTSPDLDFWSWTGDRKAIRVSCTATCNFAKSSPSRGLQWELDRTAVQGRSVWCHECLGRSLEWQPCGLTLRWRAAMTRKPPELEAHRPVPTRWRLWQRCHLVGRSVILYGRDQVAGSSVSTSAVQCVLTGGKASCYILLRVARAHLLLVGLQCVCDRGRGQRGCVPLSFW